MEEKIQILIVDDNTEIRQILKLFLESNGYELIQAINGEEALCKLTSKTNLIIMDIMMPIMDGIKCCQRIREENNVPILFLTAKSQTEDMELAYTTGGDDYLIKPFSKRELLLKVQSLLRRYLVYSDADFLADSSMTNLHELQLNPSTMELYKFGHKIELTGKEADIFFFLFEHRGEAIPNQVLFENVWGETYLKSSDNTIMVHMLKLRRKIETDPNKPEIIKTIWGKGYRIE